MGKTVADRIFDVLQNRHSGCRVDDVRIGLRYVAVKLNDGCFGVAYRFPTGGCEDIILPGNGSLASREAPELLSLIRSEILLQRSIGLATANALIGSPEGEVSYDDIRSVIELRAGETVSMVGHFEPLVADIRERCSLKIYELNTALGSGLESSTNTIEGLRNSDVALITSTAIINNTIEELLDAASDCREAAVLGPSTPLLPEAFIGTPITLLSGVEVVSDEILRVVSEGGGMQQFKQFVRKVNCRLSEK